MIKIIKRFAKFNLDEPQEVGAYEELLNHPCCHITDKTVEREKEQEYNDRGNLIRQRERIFFLVHWEQKEL